MRGDEFLRRVRRIAREQGWTCEWHPEQGKGSHGTLYVNGKLTVLRHVRDELKSGTLRAMLRQLEISTETFWRDR